jgi:predicted acetyltransferase
MELIFPEIGHKKAALDYRQEHFDAGETFMHGDGGLDSAETYEEWLKKIKAAVTRETSEELVPATVYFGIEDGRIVGMLQIRHKLNARLLKTYGHIGYGVRPSERRKGYATRMLATALGICRDMGIDKVMVSCDKNNAGSARTIINNGGVLTSDFIDGDGCVVQQYWITVV